MSNTTSTSTRIKKHPIRGFLYGIVFGLGLALIAIGQGWAALGTKPPIVILVVGIVVGTLWSMFGPAKGPKGAAPTADAPVDPEPVDPDPDTAQETTEPETAGLDGEGEMG